MDLNVAGVDSRRSSSAGSDLQHSGSANHDIQIELVSALATVVIVDRARDEGNRDGVGRIATDAAQDAGAMEVDDAHSDLW